MTLEPSVWARDVVFGFPGEPAVLKGASLGVDDQVVAVTGPSGSGKSTLLMCLAGILEPRSGSIRIAGEPLTGESAATRSRIRREKVGLVFQFSELVAELTLLENVSLPLELLGTSHRAATAAARDALVELGLRDVVARHPAHVSGGQAQRAAVARALVHQPAVVLADEPTGALDPDNAGRVLDSLLSAARRRGAAVVIVTHDAGVAGWADRAVDVRDLGSSAVQLPTPRTTV